MVKSFLSWAKGSYKTRFLYAGFYCTVVITILLAWASRAELQNYTLVNSDTETASSFQESSKFR